MGVGRKNRVMLLTGHELQERSYRSLLILREAVVRGRDVRIRGVAWRELIDEMVDRVRARFFVVMKMPDDVRR